MHIVLIGKKVKYYAAVRFNSAFNKLYAGEELTIRGIDTTSKQLVLESRTGEVWKLYPCDVRFLNNKRLTIY